MVTVTTRKVHTKGNTDIVIHILKAYPDGKNLYKEKRRLRTKFGP
jgi:hypothetical protein